MWRKELIELFPLLRLYKLHFAFLFNIWSNNNKHLKLDHWCFDCTECLAKQAELNRFNHRCPLVQEALLYEITFVSCAAGLHFHTKDQLLYEYVLHVYIKD